MHKFWFGNEVTKFEIHAAVNIKITAFWDVTPCIVVDGTYRLSTEYDVTLFRLEDP